LEAVWAGGLVRFHRVKGSKYFLFCDRFNERELTVFVNGRVGAHIKLAVMSMKVTVEKVLEKTKSFFLKDACVSGPYTIWMLKPMNYVLLPSDNRLSMEKRAIFITKFHPFLP